MHYSVEVFLNKDNKYIATSPELNVFSYGETADKAVDRLDKIINFYMESADELGVSIEELGLKNEESKKRVSSLQIPGLVIN